MGFHKIFPIHLVNFPEQQLSGLEAYEQGYLAFGIAEQVWRDSEHFGYCIKDLSWGPLFISNIFGAKDKEWHVVTIPGPCLELIEGGADVDHVGQGLDLATPLATSRDAIGLEVPGTSL